LVAFNFSTGADEALRQGHDYSLAIGAPLVVGHVLPEEFFVRVLFPQEAGEDVYTQAILEDKARDATHARVTDVLGSAAQFSVEIESGTPHASIQRLADRVAAQRIVMGPGPTAVHVARSATCPALVARASPAHGAVVAATDFSDPALPAVRAAAEEAVRRKVPLTVVHCLNIADADVMAVAAMASIPGGIGLPLLPERTLLALESAAGERLASAMAAVGASGRALVLRGAARAGIVGTAEADMTSLVVVGTRGRSGLARLVLGSVAESVITGAPCSVLAVPLHDDATPVAEAVAAHASEYGRADRLSPA